MFKGLGNLASLMKQAQEMRGRMQEVQDELSRKRVEGSAGGGMVRVEANGQQKILAVHLEDSLVESGDREMIEDLLAAAVNQALEKSKELAAQELSDIAGGLDLSGLNDAMSQLGLGGNGSPPTTGGS